MVRDWQHSGWLCHVCQRIGDALFTAAESVKYVSRKQICYERVPSRLNEEVQVTLSFTCWIFLGTAHCLPGRNFTFAYSPASTLTLVTSAIFSVTKQLSYNYSSNAHDCNLCSSNKNTCVPCTHSRFTLPFPAGIS